MEIYSPNFHGSRKPYRQTNTYGYSAILTDRCTIYFTHHFFSAQGWQASENRGLRY